MFGLQLSSFKMVSPSMQHGYFIFFPLILLLPFPFNVFFFKIQVSIASNLNFAIYMIWGLKANSLDAGTIALVLDLCAIIVYFILENFIWRQYLIYIFSPWIVIVVALAGNSLTFINYLFLNKYLI